MIDFGVAIGLVLLVFLAAGIVLVSWGLRGRVVGRGPHCRACKFDLAGLASLDDPRTATRNCCPECGSNLAATRAVVRELRGRRPWTIGMGVVLLSVPIAAIVIVVRQGSSFSISSNLPTPLLVRLVRGEPSEAVLNELAAREWANTAPQSIDPRLGPRVLARHRNPKQPWTDGWSALALALYHKGVITDAEFYKGLEASMTARLDLRDTARATGKQPILVRTDMRRWLDRLARTASVERCTAEYRNERGELVASVECKGSSRDLASGLIPEGWHDLTLDVPDLPAGTYDVTYTVVLAAGIGQYGPQEPLPLNVPVAIKRRTEIVPSTQPIVRFSDFPDQEARVRDAFDTMSVSVMRGRYDLLYVAVAAYADRIDLGLAYRVYVKPTGTADDQYIDVGAFTIPESSGHPSTGTFMTAAVPDSFKAELVDLRLDPDPFGAEVNRGISSIANVFLTFERVPVTWRTARPE